MLYLTEAITVRNYQLLVVSNKIYNFGQNYPLWSIQKNTCNINEILFRLV